MNTLFRTVFDLAGLFELDSSGKVLYSRCRVKNRLIDSNSHLVGRNFFHEIADFANIEDFRRFFDKFIISNQLSDNFVFDCHYDEQSIPIRVMLLRAYETNCVKPANIVILDIRRNT